MRSFRRRIKVHQLPLERTGCLNQPPLARLIVVHIPLKFNLAEFFENFPGKGLEVMEPVTAFSVACSVLEVIDVGLKAVKRCREIYKSENSLPSNHEELSKETSGIEISMSKLASQLANLDIAKSAENQHEGDLQQLTGECHTLACDLLNGFEGLKNAGQIRKRDVLGQLVKVSRARPEIEKLQKDLESRLQRLDRQVLLKLR